MNKYKEDIVIGFNNMMYDMYKINFNRKKWRFER